METTLLNSNEKRQYDFLNEFITRHELFVPFDEMLHNLSCSELTLRKIIKTLNETYHRPLFQSQNRDIIVLDDNLNAVNYLREFILKHSEITQLIKLLFDQQMTTVSKVQEALGCSESTLRRLIKKTNSEIKKYAVQIDLKTLEFVGQESTVRSWMTTFLLKNSLNYDRELHLNLTQKIYDELYLSFVRPNQDTYFLTSYGIHSLILSNLIRYLRGHYILHDDDIFPYIEKRGLNTDIIYHIIDEFDTTVLDRGDSPEEIVYQLLYPFLDPTFCIDCQNAEYKDNVEFLAYYIKFVESIQKHFNIKLNHPQNLYQNLMITHYYFNHQMYISNFSENLIKQMEIMFPYFTEYVRLYIQRHLIVNKQHLPIYIKMITNCIILYWPHLYLELNQSLGKMKALLIPRHSASHGRWIRNIIKMETSRHISIDIIDNIQLDFSHVKLSDYDLIISQIRSEKIDHPYVIQIGPTINYDNLLEILTHLKRVKKEKQEARHHYGILSNR